MSGNAPIIQATFLKRSNGTITEYTAIPQTSRLNYNFDVRRIANSFDIELSFGADETFPVKSHDFVEFFFMLDGAKYQIGCGFLEDFMIEDGVDSFVLRVNGRSQTGQLMLIPFKVQSHYASMQLFTFLSTALRDTYVADYAAFRNLKQSIVDQGAYQGNLAVVTDMMRKRGAIVQEYADLALNLVYQNRLGQVVVYGRTADADGNFVKGKAVGTIIRSAGKSNVSRIIPRDDFSKVYSDFTVFYVAAEKNLDQNQMVSPLFQNTDPRVQHISNPGFRTFSASDLISLSGTTNHAQRVAQVAKSEIRKSNQSLGAVVVVCDEPFITDPETGAKIPFEGMQIWRVVNDARGIDKEMVLASISYSQEPSGITVQLGFVEPDTLV